jgi:hypothetical protein
MVPRSGDALSEGTQILLEIVELGWKKDELTAEGGQEREPDTALNSRTTLRRSSHLYPTEAVGPKQPGPVGRKHKMPSLVV